MKDDDLISFAKNCGVADSMERIRNNIIITDIIDKEGLTLIEVGVDTLRAKGVKDEMAVFVKKINIPGVTIVVEESGENLLISVDKEKYANGSTLKTVEEDSKLTTDYFFFPEEAPIIKRLIQEKFNVLLVGPAGCGKSECLERIITNELKRKALPFNMTEETTTDDFIGQIVLRGMETKFEPGPLYTAMKGGMVLIIDELDVAEQGILFVLQRVLEGKDLIVVKNGNERLLPTEGFAICGTANTCGRGEHSDIYRSRQILDEAFLDRWNAVFTIDYPSPAEEVKILTKRTGLPKNEAKIITKIASMIRESFDKEIISTFSVRKSLAIARLMIMGISLESSFKIAVLNKATYEDAVTMAEVFQRVSGTSIQVVKR